MVGEDNSLLVLESTLELKAELSERPDIVVIVRRKFTLLPSQFVFKSILTREADKKLFYEIKAVYADETGSFCCR